MAATTASYCRLCPASCGVLVTVEDGVAIRLTGDRADPASRGYVCPKGRRMIALTDDPRRLDEPMLRDGGGNLVPVDWDTALGDLGEKLAAIRDEFGAYAVGMYAGTMLDTAGRAAGVRFMDAIGSPSTYTSLTIDAVAKVFVTRLMSGRERAWPATDFDTTTLLVILGENMVVSHGGYSYVPDPISYLRQVTRRGEVWVIDPRRTETARLATRHLVPRSGTDFAVLAHLVREVLVDGADTGYLTEHARHVDELRTAVEPFDRATASRISGIAPENLDELLVAIRQHRRLGVVTGTGVSMASTGNVAEWMAFALQIVTGSFERPGGRWFNHGATFDAARPTPSAPVEFEPGPRTRPEIGRVSGQYPSALMPAEIEAGHLHALLVTGGNPMTAFPQPDRLGAALDRLGVLAVWDLVHTATTTRATHVFPCPDPLERADLKIPIHLPAVYAQYTPQVVTRRAGRRSMWWSLAKVAERLDVSIFADHADPDALTDDDVLAMQVAGTTVDWDALRAAGGPVEYPRVDRWVEETVLADGRWDVAPAVLVPRLAGAINHPVHDLVLGNRREMHHTNSALAWEGGAGTDPHPFIYVNPSDAEAAGVHDGDDVEVVSAHGALRGTVRVDDAVARGVVVVPHGFAEPNVGHLTAIDSDLDPLTGMPTLVGVPVSLRPAALGPA